MVSFYKNLDTGFIKRDVGERKARGICEGEREGMAEEGERCFVGNDKGQRKGVMVKAGR